MRVITSPLNIYPFLWNFIKETDIPVVETVIRNRDISPKSKIIEKLHKGVLAKEYGRQYKSEGKQKVAAVYPNRYQVAMSSLAFQWLVNKINKSTGFFPERLFLPGKEEQEIYKKRSRPLLTLDNNILPSNLAAWFVTFSFENDYPNFARMLIMAGIEALSRKRTGTEPLIIAGGAAVTLNPRPIGPFVDLILLGEGNAMMDPVLDILGKARSKKDFLQSVSELDYAFVPGQTDKGKMISVAREKDFGKDKIHTRVFTSDTEFDHGLLIEAYRGCRSRCRFCAAGHLYLPPREARDLESFFLEPLPKQVNMTGLVGAGVSSLSKIEKWIDMAASRGRVGISSIRVNTLSDKALSSLAGHGAKSVALAPETGTERLRGVCNKGDDDKAIIEESARLIEQGFQNLKLYFMVGLPTESENDIKAIGELVIRIKEKIMPLWKKRGEAGEIQVSVNPFVPKAQTPFQWAPFIDKKSYNKAKKIINNALKAEGNVRPVFESYKEARLQAIFSAGWEDAGELILKLASGQTINQAITSWQSNTKMSIHKKKKPDAVFPWSFIDAGFNRDYLKRESLRGEKGKTTPDCQVDKCTLCGICGK